MCIICTSVNAATASGETALGLARRSDTSALIKGEYNGHWKALGRNSQKSAL